MTLRHGDPLNLTCTIELAPAVDIAVAISGTLNGQGIQNPNYESIRHTSSRIYKINETISSLVAARPSVYTCTATVSPGSGAEYVMASQMTSTVLNVTVGMLNFGQIEGDRGSKKIYLVPIESPCYVPCNMT